MKNSPANSRAFDPAKTTLNDWAQLFVHGLAVVGVIFVYIQYEQNSTDTRVERTLLYVSEFRDQDTGVGLAQRDINDILWKNENNISQVAAIPEDDTRKAEIHQKMVFQWIDSSADSKSPLANSLNEMVSFMESLWVCVEESLCDESAAARFFSQYAARFERNFAPYIQNRMLYAPPYAHGLKGIAALDSDQ
ncbi:hypothetical protein [Granulosicoccus antarcticus]|uniref:DUF4760 domain-containing protein n=1 Tax=Granulosicoccus antarcticus IMCC3135 TaxID=1192854 RepID=A0A2Z2P5I4_9GAMM|nr:hypothetical protein [Granulosicoccus antarcticus]ASJ76770.1 hypothetical protein IMCC3135_33645 [Granulosicoccus antarcticus IMCC3135]